MLKYVEIGNFQSLKDLKINLNYPVVAITGPTDSGKSAILRAVKNAIFDGVGGGYYRKESKDGKPVTYKSMRVKIVSDSGNVEWLKTDKDATYIINDSDKRENCGKTVPEEVPKALGLTSEKYVGENLHYRNQFEAAFLLKDRGPKDAYRFISNLMGADIVIKCLDTLEKTSRELAKDEKAHLKLVEQAENSLNSYFTETDITEMETSYADLTLKSDKIASYEKAIESVKGVQVFHKQYLESGKKYLDARDCSNKLLEVLDRINVSHTMSEALNKKLVLLQKVKDLSAKVSGIDERLKNSKKYTAFNLLSFVCKYELYDKYVSKNKALDKVVSDKTKLSKIDIKTVPSIEKLTQDYKRYTEVQGSVAALTKVVDKSRSCKSISDKIVSNGEQLAILKKDLPEMLESGKYRIIGDGEVEIVGTVYVPGDSIKVERL